MCDGCFGFWLCKVAACYNWSPFALQESGAFVNKVVQWAATLYFDSFDLLPVTVVKLRQRIKKKINPLVVVPATKKKQTIRRLAARGSNLLQSNSTCTWKKGNRHLANFLRISSQLIAIGIGVLRL